MFLRISHVPRRLITRLTALSFKLIVDLLTGQLVGRRAFVRVYERTISNCIDMIFQFQQAFVYIV